MIELPESNTLAKQLKEELTGKKVDHVIAGHTPHGFAFYDGGPESYEDLLIGKTIDDAVAVGGNIEVFAEDISILLGEGLSIRYLEPGMETPKKHQLYIGFIDGAALVCTIQLYGFLSVNKIGGYDSNKYYMEGKIKPSPLTEEFNRDYFYHIIENVKPTLSTKALLATEQRIPGLGNGVLQDILFDARINPKRKVQTLSNNEKEQLFLSIKSVLKKMTELGGRDTEKDIYGKNGGYLSILSKKTINEPCIRCGGDIVRKTFLGGNIYYCTNCQEI